MLEAVEYFFLFLYKSGFSAFIENDKTDLRHFFPGFRRKPFFTIPFSSYTQVRNMLQLKG